MCLNRFELVYMPIMKLKNTQFSVPDDGFIEKPEDDDTILREVVGDDANDKKRKQELIEQELDKFRNC